MGEVSLTDVAELDPRVHVVRPDLAAASLRAAAPASRYAEPQLRQCVCGVVPVFAEPTKTSKRVSEIRYGEFLDVFEQREDGFLWIQNRSDRYVGYINPAQPLSEQVAMLSSRIKALCTYVYAEPDRESAVLDNLTLGSYVQSVEEVGDFTKLASGGYVFTRHIAPTEELTERDYVFTAGRLLNVPYLAGGRTPRGVDAAGLVQLALELAGFDDCPRDSDLQAEAYGHALPAHWRDVAWRRGDLVFLEGSVGIMTNQENMIHADTYAMQVVVEPLAQVILRGAKIVAMGRP